MTQRVSIVMMAGLAWGLMTGCQKQADQTPLDKDEVHGFVVAQELSNSRVQCIAEDAAGQLWIGTFRGLNRYDGHEYHQYFCANDSTGLPDNQVKDLLRDQKGRLWVATVNGVCRYNRQDNFDRIPVRSQNLNTQKLLEDSQGRVFVWNETELLRYDEGQKHLSPVLPVKANNSGPGAIASSMRQTRFSSRRVSDCCSTMRKLSS